MPHYENVPFEVPESWAWTTIEEICSKIGSGSTPRGSNYSATGIPFFRSQNVYNDRLVYDDIKYISEEVHQKMKGTEVLANDLLLNITGGSLGRCAVVPADFNRGNVSQHVCIMRPVLVEPKYFHALVLSSCFAKSMKITGSGREGLPKYNLEQMGFPLPPLTEQQRIVAAIEHWFALIDQIEQGKADLQIIIKQTKSKILDLAIHGKLVSQDPNDEPAIELLKRINPDFTPCDNGHYLFDLPSSWLWCKLGDLCKIRGGKRIPKGKGFATRRTEHIYLRVTNMKNQTILLDDLKYIEDDVFEEIKNYTISSDDLYLTIAGTIGDVGEIPKEVSGMNLTENAAKLTGIICDKMYLMYSLLSSNPQEHFKSKFHQVAQPKLSIETASSTLLPLPPLDEQQRIVQKIEEIFSFLDDIQAALEV